MSGRLPKILALLGILAAGSGLLAACSDVRYYLQAAQGHGEILLKRRPIATLLADPATDPGLRERLQLVLDIRNFASRELHLPENGSYRCYADLGRNAVVWNVVAAPEFSLDAMTWCFPVAGCVSYRGYYRRSAAEDFAGQLQRQGNDTDVYGVTAYSTLGWFDDPVLNTFVDRPEPALAGMIFHELAHQRLYVKDDSSFSEAFAEVVEQEGVARWLRSRGGEDLYRKNEETVVRQREFNDFLLAERTGLAELYASALDVGEKRRAKARRLAEIPERYRRLKEERWGGFAGFDRWFERPVNNARLAAVATYHDRKAPLLKLLRDGNGDLDAFYRRAEELSRLPKAERRARLEGLTQPAAPR